MNETLHTIIYPTQHFQPNTFKTSNHHQQRLQQQISTKTLQRIVTQFKLAYQ